MTNIIFHFSFLIFNFLDNHSPILYLTQSLWRDEAFSILLAEKNPLTIIKLTAQDFNPPLYYLLLHFWIKIFGRSEISVRMLSFIFHVLLVYVGYKFAQKIFKSKSTLLHCYIATLLFINPMLLYYAFEARMYSLLALLTTLSFYYFFQKKWPGYLLFTTLGLYTQPFMILAVITQLAYAFLTSGLSKRIIKPLIIPLALYLPWILTLIIQVKRTGDYWIHPVDLKLILSSLGNLFLGFEGNPAHLWKLAKIVSLTIFLLTLKATGFNHKKTRKATFLFFLWVFLPLSFTFIISLFKPIYLNRYLIYVTVGEIFILVLGIKRVTSKMLRAIFTFSLFLFTFYFNFWFAPFHKKENFKRTMLEINLLATQEDLIVANSALSFFELTYYAKNPSLCFLLSKKGEPIPSYIGKAIIPPEKILSELPLHAKRYFLVFKDASFEIVYNLKDETRLSF